jgi:CRP-like cAMP-binding protein
MKQSSYLNADRRLIASLRQIDAFGPLPETTLRSLLRISLIRQYRAGEVIFREGSIDHWIYFMVYGKIRITKGSKEIAILRRRGDICGEMAVIGGTSRSASAHAVANTVCIATDGFKIDRLTGNDRNAFGFALYQILASVLVERLRQTTEELNRLKNKRGLRFW